MKPVLLGTDNHTRSHESHERDDLVRCETMAVDEIGANQATSSAQTSLAVDSDSLLAHSDGLVSKSNKLADSCERRTCAIVENHVQMLNTQSLEV